MEDKSLKDLANTYIDQFGRISKDEMLSLIHLIKNTSIENTSIENTSLKYIKDHYNCTASAILLYNKYFKIQ